jgi:hypothetical protein
VYTGESFGKEFKNKKKLKYPREFEEDKFVIEKIHAMALV